MNNVYEVTHSTEGQDMIVIRRKPSQIPWSIDRDLMSIGTVGHLDGPNSKMSYEFFQNGGLARAEAFLQRCGWKKADK